MKKVKDIMHTHVITTTPDKDLKEVARLLLDHDIPALPVLDENNHIVGIIGESDLIHQDQRLHLPTMFFILDTPINFEPWKLEQEMRYLMGQKVADLMRKKVYTVKPEDSIPEVSDIIVERKQEIIPVVENDRLVGIVGKKDIIRLHLSEE